jgi:hypothetical protein
LSVVETVLVFVGIPLVIFAILAIGVFGRPDVSQRTRYRPGKPWVFAPVWYLPRPIEGDHRASRAMAHELVEGPSERLALPAAGIDVKPAGGASGEW